MDLQTLLSGVYGVLGTYVIPTLIFLCVVVFLYNVIRYFIWQSGSEAGRDNSRRYLIWSMMGFILVVALWGIISLLLTTLGTPAGSPPRCSDYQSSNAIGPIPNCIP